MAEYEKNDLLIKVRKMLNLTSREAARKIGKGAETTIGRIAIVIHAKCL